MSGTAGVKTEADENKEGMVSMHFGNDVSVHVQLNGMDPVDTIASLLGWSTPPNAGAAGGAQIGEAAPPRKESGKYVLKLAKKDANSGAAAAVYSDWQSVLADIFMPQCLPHKTRCVLASTCKLLRASVDKYYNVLISRIEKRQISTVELWREKIFDIESLLKYYNEELNTEPYPEYTERGFYLYSAEVPSSSLGATNAFLMLEEETEFEDHEQLAITVKRFCIHFSKKLMQANHVISLVVLEWMLAEDVNILTKNDSGMNLMHAAAYASNYRAIERLLKIPAKHVVHEVLHTPDRDRLLPHHYLQKSEYGLLLYPKSILIRNFLTGHEYPQSELMQRIEPEPKQKIWEVSLKMPAPISELAAGQKEFVYWYNCGAFANILFWVKPEKRVGRIEQLVLQLQNEHGFDAAGHNVFEQMQRIMQISQEDTSDDSANAKLCIESLKETLGRQCEDEDCGYGNPFTVCIGREDINCFKFLQSIAEIIYSAEDLQKLYLNTEHEMTLLEVSIQTRRPDIVLLVLGLDIPMEVNLQPGQFTVTGPRWSIVSLSILRGKTEALQIICNKCLEVQNEHLARGEPLPEALKPTYKSNGQTYWELLHDENSHTAFFDGDQYLLHNWSWDEDELDDLEAQNKNDPVTREQMHEILNDWKKKFDLKNIAHGIEREFFSEFGV